jgi:tyrosyl-DNA phosphodiesterase 2
MAAPRIERTLSAFNASTRSWVSVSSRIQSNIPTLPRSRHVQETLTLTSWNIDAFSPRPGARASRILSHILGGPNSTDIVFLQEVTRGVRASLLREASVFSGFFATDAEDETSFEGVPFATMTLLSRARFTSVEEETAKKRGGEGTEGRRKLVLGPVSRVKLPSKYRRDALCVDILSESPTSSGRVLRLLRLLNVHLDSLADTIHYRVKQMRILAGILREDGYGRGIIAGDFNATTAEDEGLVDENGLEDVWVALHGRKEPGGVTWAPRRDGLQPRRLDKVAMMGLRATKIEVLRPGAIEVPRPGKEDYEIGWSDHCGLRCSFKMEV